MINFPRDESKNTCLNRSSFCYPIHLRLICRAHGYYHQRTCLALSSVYATCTWPGQDRQPASEIQNSIRVYAHIDRLTVSTSFSKARSVAANRLHKTKPNLNLFFSLAPTTPYPHPILSLCTGAEMLFNGLWKSEN
ncbi:hypothetical protein MPTK1_4g12530 [Marchantia polymorpha subsp. ruderalis]|uniref:Uncharacterized protein n=2 Tax=Marchantia polymorpha TaxID=3197 RepID=A0AAF6B978_MARPO|nr:hypothetical protein MARPO_0174s0015 [Marchantia polymorpha]BBN08562.1 hypothetical protein Mp_4g12530 [Marchantia polymorpha subsp. ruderalis]|eukprot:PTQ28088.1 hypothetical protein MARPO_0174s0015 [Marchantia polymorpha]